MYRLVFIGKDRIYFRSHGVDALWFGFDPPKSFVRKAWWSATEIRKPFVSDYD